MEMLIFWFLQLVFLQFGDAGIYEDTRLGVSKIRQRIMGRLPGRQLSKKEICYDMIGCFDQHRKGSIKKSPQSPDAVDTKFWLFTRETLGDLLHAPVDQVLNFRSAAQLIHYDDNGDSVKRSAFNASRPMKVLIHGFKGSGKDKGALRGVRAFLLHEDLNMVVVDWEKGAADSYPTAAANTALIGRQTAVMLAEMLSRGQKDKSVHVIGFSLGAHIAGCAGDMLKSKGYLLGRITGLDPASPLFKHQFFRESATKLDFEDAEFVDVVHTDGSPVFTDGFGLLRPIGHVDFFPNGGREQPGCSDGRGSVVVSTLEGTINSSVACSHVRAWQLFLESAENLIQEDGCQFVGYPCTGGAAQFGDGRCFLERPLGRCLPGDQRCNVMGMGARPDGARGVLYLSTRGEAPFCGEQLQAEVRTSQETQPTRGYLHMRLSLPNPEPLSTNFRFTNEIDDGITGGRTLTAVSSADPSMFLIADRVLTAEMSFQSLEFQNGRPNIDVILEEISVRGRQGSVWRTCAHPGKLVYFPDSSFGTLKANLTKDVGDAHGPFSQDRDDSGHSNLSSDLIGGI